MKKNVMLNWPQFKFSIVLIVIKLLLLNKLKIKKRMENKDAYFTMKIIKNSLPL